MISACEFQFGFVDVSARADASFLASQNKDYADISDLVREVERGLPDVVTLEPGFGWPLDGSKEWLPDDPENTPWGWWSTELSGEDLTFEHPPTLAISFFDDTGEPTPHSSAGVTLSFAATLPKSVSVSWYDREGALLAAKTVTPTGSECYCDCQVEDYYSMTITIPAMSAPRRYLRVTSILFGVLEILDSARLTKATLTEEISPVALTLPVNKAEISFHTPDGRFSLLDPSGAYKLFQYKQELTGYKTIDGERRLLGTYYLQEASGTVDAVTELSCVDIIGVLDTVEYKGGIYDAIPLPELLGEILDPEGVDYELDSTLADVKVSGHLPIGSMRSALQQIAFAAGAIVDTAGTEAMRIYPAPTEITKEITPARKIIGHKAGLEPLVTQVDVTAHSYALGTELKSLTKTTLTPGEHTINFSRPASVKSVSGATLTLASQNYCVVTLSNNAEVTVSGFEYEDTQTVYTVKTDHLPAGAKQSAKSISNATLVSPGNAAEVAERLYNYYQLRYSDEGRLLPGHEHAGELATVSSLGGRALTGYIQRVVTDLTGGCLETITLRGR